jgi:hypothetical protein
LFNIRANFGRADFFEFGVGYKFGRRWWDMLFSL